MPIQGQSLQAIFPVFSVGKEPGQELAEHVTVVSLLTFTVRGYILIQLFLSRLLDLLGKYYNVPFKNRFL